MVFKLFKLCAMVVGGGLLVGAVAFGTDLASYLRSSARSVRVAVKDNIPVEFELRRARDLLDQIDPEMHDNVRAIAEHEVAVATLKREIDENKLALADERQRVGRLREAVASNQTSFSFGDLSFSRGQLTQELSRRFTHLKEAEAAQAAKQLLLENRQKTLVAAQEAIETARAQKATLEAQIETLEAQYQLVKAASATSNTGLAFDHSKLAQAKKAVGDIRQELAVAERMLVHEAKFTASVPMDVVDEKDLLTQVDAHLNGTAPAATAAIGAGQASPTN
jgi:predicted  nucleic acid-binding Zn-ribbon protein